MSSLQYRSNSHVKIPIKKHFILTIILRRLTYSEYGCGNTEVLQLDLHLVLCWIPLFNFPYFVYFYQQLNHHPHNEPTLAGNNPKSQVQL